MKRFRDKSIGYVYKITSPSKKIYIGSTNRIERRKSYYKTLKCKNQFKIYNSIQKYGWNAHVFEIIWSGEANERFSKELEYGLLFNVLDKDMGLNLKLPKINENVPSISNELREKFSKILKNRIIKNGKPLNTRIISSYDKDGNYLNTFESIRNAAIHYNITSAMIGKVLSHNYNNSSKNMQFKYGNNTSNIGKIPRWKKIQKNVGKFSLNNELLEVLPSVSCYVDKYNYPRSSIYKCLRNIMQHCVGYKWQFVKQDPLNQ